MGNIYNESFMFQSFLQAIEKFQNACSNWTWSPRVVEQGDGEGFTPFDRLHDLMGRPEFREYHFTYEDDDEIYIKNYVEERMIFLPRIILIQPIGLRLKWAKEVQEQYSSPDFIAVSKLDGREYVFSGAYLTPVSFLFRSPLNIRKLRVAVFARQGLFWLKIFNVQFLTFICDFIIL